MLSCACSSIQKIGKMADQIMVLQLILRSINSSRSAYASISFINTFFDAYNIFGTAVVQAGVLAKVRHLHPPAHASGGLPHFQH